MKSIQFKIQPISHNKFSTHGYNKPLDTKHNLIQSKNNEFEKLLQKELDK